VTISDGLDERNASISLKVSSAGSYNDPKYRKKLQSGHLQLTFYRSQAFSVYSQMQWNHCISLHLNGIAIHLLWSHMCQASAPGHHSAKKKSTSMVSLRIVRMPSWSEFRRHSTGSAAVVHSVGRWPNRPGCKAWREGHRCATAPRGWKRSCASSGTRTCGTAATCPEQREEEQPVQVWNWKFRFWRAVQCKAPKLIRCTIKKLATILNGLATVVRIHFLPANSSQQLSESTFYRILVGLRRTPVAEGGD